MDKTDDSVVTAAAAEATVKMNGLQQTAIPVSAK